MRPIPDSIKSEIIKKHLEGYSISEIHKDLGVSSGAISAITNEEGRKNEYYLYIHEIAKKFRSKNLEFSDVVSGVRLYNKIKKVGLTCSFFENFLESTNTESFRLNKDIAEFLEEIKRILHYEKVCRVKIGKIPAHMHDAINHHNHLRRQNNELIKENNRLYVQHRIEKAEVEEYLEHKPSFLRYEREKRDTRYNEWIEHPTLFEEASKKIGTKIEPQTLYNRLNRVYILPNKYTNIIKKLMAIDENDWPL